VSEKRLVATPQRQGTRRLVAREKNVPPGIVPSWCSVVRTFIRFVIVLRPVARTVRIVIISASIVIAATIIITATIIIGAIVIGTFIARVTVFVFMPFRESGWSEKKEPQ
jgi:hypothetical protein